MIDDEKRVSRELGVSAERLPLRIAVTLLPGTSLVLMDSSFVVRDGGRAYSLRDCVRGAIPFVDKKLSCFRGALRTLDDAKGVVSGRPAIHRVISSEVKTVTTFSQWSNERGWSFEKT
jgi:hypothetical protein